jgi:hypothetical protein
MAIINITTGGGVLYISVLGVATYGPVPAQFVGGVSAGVYGDGGDGAVVFDGSTTILGMAPSSNIYTLTRSLFCTNLTINSGVTIMTAGYKIFCSGTLTNNSNGAAGTQGGIDRSGTTGNAGAGTNGGGTTTGLTAAELGGSIAGGGGGNGQTGAGATATAAASAACGGGIGGQGGAGGLGSGGAGGGGSTLGTQTYRPARHVATN